MAPNAVPQLGVVVRHDLHILALVCERRRLPCHERRERRATRTFTREVDMKSDVHEVRRGGRVNRAFVAFCSRRVSLAFLSDDWYRNDILRPGVSASCEGEWLGMDALLVRLLSCVCRCREHTAIPTARYLSTQRTPRNVRCWRMSGRKRATRVGMTCGSSSTAETE